MKVFSRVIIGLGLLMGSGACAMADIVWTLNDVFLQFPHNGGINEVTGNFTTDNSVDTIEKLLHRCNGPGKTEGNFHTLALMVDAYLPGTIGIANSDFSKYVDLYLSSPLTSAGGKVDMGSGFDCPGCGECSVNADHTPSVIGVASTPEPFPPFHFWARVCCSWARWCAAS